MGAEETGAAVGMGSFPHSRFPRSTHLGSCVHSCGRSFTQQTSLLMAANHFESQTPPRTLLGVQTPQEVLAPVSSHARTHAHARIQALPEAAPMVELPINQVSLHQVHVLAADPTGAAEGGGGAVHRVLALGRGAS